MTTNVRLSFDRSAPPANTAIWNNVRNGFSPVGNPSLVRPVRSRDWFKCQSDSDTQTGACSQGWFHGGGSGQLSTIKLRMVEKRSRVSIDIPIMGRSGSCQMRTHTGAQCTPPVWRQINNGGYIVGHNVKILHIFLTAENLAAIPTGGIWEGTLILELREWGAGAVALKAHMTANITLDVTDRFNGQIYLPAFGSATPLVDLNLRTRPLSTAPGGQVSGGTVIDTCLYDGYNSNSPWLNVTLSDTAAVPGRGADIFSVVKEGASATDARNRVDYRVTMNYNGTPQAMENGKALRLSGVNTAIIRPVALPGYPVPVVCIPAPLALKVQPFAKASKTAGRYRGTLRINLAAETLAP